MKLPVYFTASMLLGLAFTAPTSNEDTKVAITEDFFADNLVVYTAEHEVVNLLLPINKLNFEDDNGEEKADTALFFVLADNENGQRIDQGLYVRKKGVVTKLLDNGRDAAADNDNTSTVYFGAKDGIYSYNEEQNKAEKYGNITDSIISIAKVNGSDIIYTLTEDHVLYKVTESGNVKEKIDSVVDAQRIVLDFEDTLYYYTADKSVYVMGSDGAKKVTGLAAEPAFVDILKPPFVMENGILALMDDKVYIVYPNATAQMSDFEFKVRPTAYSMEATLVQYFAYNKKIYEYNVLNLLFSEITEDMKTFLENQSESISEIASWARAEFQPASN